MYCISNYYLDKKIKEYKESNKNLSLKEIKREFIWLKENDSMSLTNSLEDLNVKNMIEEKEYQKILLMHHFQK